MLAFFSLTFLDLVLSGTPTVYLPRLFYLSSFFYYWTDEA